MLGVPLLSQKFGKAWQGMSTSVTPHLVLGATKWCVFKPVSVSRPLVMNAVRDRMERMGTTSVDLLQARLDPWIHQADF
ncbi:hypothetical protein H0H87_004460 [Tephrocybe sp. NHM501043]|nr:hypothetical protein H0H87_004460 [Tephrocybe sp. NHM501043]